MADLTLRNVKNAPLTNQEVDDNFTNLNDDKAETDGATLTNVDINSGTIDSTTIGGSTPAAGSFTTVTGSGDMAIDTDTLFVDVSEDRVGIGESSPSATLELKNPDQNPSIFRINNSYNATTSEFGIDFYRNTDSGNDLAVAYVKALRTGGDITHLVFGTTSTPGTVTERLRIDSGGDVSFRDTSDNEAFYWDASAASLGIGTDSPANTTHVKTDSNGNGITIQRNSTTEGTYGQLSFMSSTDDAGTPNVWIRGYRGTTFTDNYMAFGTGSTAGTEAMRIDSGGDISFYEDTGTTPKLFWDANGERLYIGDNTVSSNNAANNFVIGSTGSTGMSFISGDSDAQNIMFGDATDQASGRIQYFHDDDHMEFSVNGGSEAMRIDSSGNLLVGQSSTTIPGVGNTTAGTSIRAGSASSIAVSRDNDAPAYFNRNSDGIIASFRKDGSSVGSIGTNTDGQFAIAGASGETGFYFGNARVSPARDFAPIDDTLDFGTPLARWDDIYATNGTIQTSDRNEKQDIEELSEAEQRVAVAAKGLLRKFRWKSAVEEKGDDARIHFGIIAQDLQAAFEAEGLDAGRYAMFISSTWWESEETYTDDEGVEQTRINTYDTAEEAPEGATERTRLGVRYSELLAFIIAAI